mmetsp:Transcript_13023/g.33245  ORF Transcript_13023/g.33245 Transcript_13023/m.33245 type:complete len:242 (+) Transcript_13023:1395-2120(+)
MSCDSAWPQATLTLKLRGDTSIHNSPAPRIVSYRPHSSKTPRTIRSTRPMLDLGDREPYCKDPRDTVPQWNRYVCPLRRSTLSFGSRVRSSKTRSSSLSRASIRFLNGNTFSRSKTQRRPTGMSMLAGCTYLRRVEEPEKRKAPSSIMASSWWSTRATAGRSVAASPPGGAAAARRPLALRCWAMGCGTAAGRGDSTSLVMAPSGAACCSGASWRRPWLICDPVRWCSWEKEDPGQVSAAR